MKLEKDYDKQLAILLPKLEKAKKNFKEEKALEDQLAKTVAIDGYLAYDEAKAARKKCFLHCENLKQSILKTEKAKADVIQLRVDGILPKDAGVASFGAETLKAKDHVAKSEQTKKEKDDAVLAAAAKIKAKRALSKKAHQRKRKK